GKKYKEKADLTGTNRVEETASGQSIFRNESNKTSPNIEGSTSTRTSSVTQGSNSERITIPPLKRQKALSFADEPVGNPLPPTDKESSISVSQQDDDELLCLSQESFLSRTSGQSRDSFSMSLDEGLSNYSSTEKTSLTTDEFNYTIKLLDQRINALYQLCRFIVTKQKETSKNIKKLLAFDELSDSFWNKAYKEVAKELIPKILYPSTKEYRIALERYLNDHANHFIGSIGRNAWISYFTEKLLPEVKNKCRIKRNDLASAIRSAVFTVFSEEQLEMVDNTMPSAKLAEWKTSEKTRAAYNLLFENNELIISICYSAFKQFHGKNLSPMHCAYTMAICDILLNPKSSSIKCSDKAITRRVRAFMKPQIEVTRIDHPTLCHKQKVYASINRKFVRIRNLEYLPDIRMVSSEDPEGCGRKVNLGDVPKRNTSGTNNLRFRYNEGIDVKKDECKAFHEGRK
ncbi:2655_t:CDS:2, partial [Dentiscutata heterogama]